MGISEEAQRVTSRGAVSSADLGGSSNYKSVKPFGLMWRRFSCRLCLGMSDSVLREWRKSLGREHYLLLPFAPSPRVRGRCPGRGAKEKLRISKGMLVNIPATHAAWEMLAGGILFFSCSAVTQRVLGDACERDGEYLLFLLTIRGSCELD